MGSNPTFRNAHLVFQFRMMWRSFHDDRKSQRRHHGFAAITTVSADLLSECGLSRSSGCPRMGSIDDHRREHETTHPACREAQGPSDAVCLPSRVTPHGRELPRCVDCESATRCAHPDQHTKYQYHEHRHPFRGIRESTAGGRQGSRPK
jgi:hypothetical protein